MVHTRSATCDCRQDRPSKRPENPLTAAMKSLAHTAYWSAAGLVAGVRLAMPGIPVMALFGVGFGTAAAQNGLTHAEATLMSAFVFAGASQFVAGKIWTNPMSAAGVAAIGLITRPVNLRLS